MGADFAAVEVGTLVTNWPFQVGRSSNGGWGAAAKPRGIGAMTKLDLLYTEQTKKFDEICTLVARELGYGAWSTLSVVDRNQVEDEAEQYVEQWDETVELQTSPTIRPMTPLRRLLSEYHTICERILDEREIEDGLWAYRRRSQTRRTRPSR